MQLSDQLDITDRRRENLKRLCAERYGSNKAELARIAGINPNQINLALTDNEANRRPIGENFARRIEANLELPALWLDRDPTATDAFAIPAGEFAPEMHNVLTTSSTLASIGVKPQFLAANRVASPERLLIAEVTSDGMAPEIKPGEQVILEWLGDESGKPARAEKAFTLDGVYIIDTKIGTLLRRIQRKVDATYLITSPNSAYEAEARPNLKGITFYARLVTPLRFG